MIGRTNAGFSLIELVVVIVVVGIVATATWSRLALLAPKYRLIGVARAVAAEVQRARTRAISEGRCATVEIDRIAKTVRVGVATTASTSCSSVSYAYEGPNPIDESGSIDVESGTTPGAAPINPVFNPRGACQPSAGAYPSIRFYDTLGDGKLVLVNATGRVQIQ